MFGAVAVDDRSYPVPSTSNLVAVHKQWASDKDVHANGKSQRDELQAGGWAELTQPKRPAECLEPRRRGTLQKHTTEIQAPKSADRKLKRVQLIERPHHPAQATQLAKSATCDLAHITPTRSHILSATSEGQGHKHAKRGQYHCPDRGK